MDRSGGNGGFGGGGGGGMNYDTTNDLGCAAHGNGEEFGIGGFGGGWGGGGQGGVLGGSGGSAYGPAIFNYGGNVTIINSGSSYDASVKTAIAGTGTGGGNYLDGNIGCCYGTNGNADSTPVYSYTGTALDPYHGTINGSAATGPISGALPSALPATSFKVSVSPSSIILGRAATITVTAYDPNSNQTIAYNGTANLTATDGNSKSIAVSPASLTFTNGVASSSTMTLNTVDWDITVSATDSYSSYITGTSGNITMTETLSLSPTATTLDSDTVGVA